MSDIKISVSPQSGDLVIRQGSAPDVLSPVPLRISGQITTPRVFYENRKNDANAVVRNDFRQNEDPFSPGSCNIQVDRVKRSITLFQGDQSPVCNIIQGSLQLSPHFVKLGINSETPRRPKDLAKTLRELQFLFYDKPAGLKLISELMNFTGKVGTDLQDHNDQRGNTKQAKTTSLEANIPKEFFMNVPLFAGGDRVRLKIEVHLDVVQGQAVDCFLYCFDAIESLEEETNRIINEELKAFEKSGIPILEI